MKLRIGIPIAFISIALLGSAVLLVLRPARSVSGTTSAAAGHSMTMNMSDADMADMARRYWATHARVGATSAIPLRTNAVVETVTVNNFLFDADGDPSTQIDTVRVAPGDIVHFQWLGGMHTATSGKGSTDPNMGVIFNQPMDAADTSFDFTSAVAETVPFFCQFHEIFNMKGILEFASPLVGVDPAPVGTGIGFASHPWPNPTTGRVSFRYALRRGGHVFAEVLDARGRHVATVLDLDRAAGTFDAAWDGRLASGRAAPVGRYFLRLSVPGATGSQAITLMR